MEGQPGAYPAGAKAGERSEKVCSREERKKRKTSGVAAEEAPAGQQRQRDSASGSSASQGSHL